MENVRVDNVILPVELAHEDSDKFINENLGRELADEIFVLIENTEGLCVGCICWRHS